jgi:metallo-beta-lactamase family protein
MIKLHFLGGAKSVTGANYLLEIDNKKILVDCGMFQGVSEVEKKNKADFLYNPAEIDFVLITHAHLDHVGRLPRLIKHGYSGPIFSTGPTADFTQLILEDAEHILEEKARKEGIIPLFDHTEIEKIMESFKRVDYDVPFQLTDNVKVCFKEAGHVLGSAIIEIEVSDKGSEDGGKNPSAPLRTRKIVFSGDLGYHPVPFLREPAEIKDADYLIVESTYGNRKHESLKHCAKVIENSIEAVALRKSVLLIPSFALERTQRLLYHINLLMENKKVPEMPVFIDSPLALKITDIYKKYSQYYDQEALSLMKRGDDIFNFPGLNLAYTSRQSKEILRVKPPKIIIAGSGMSHGGRIMHHEVNYLSDPNNILLIVSYQAEGTIGRQLLEGAREVEINDQRIPVRAEIRHISGYSSHADSSQVFQWVANSKKTVKKVFVVQGEEEAANILAQNIRDHLGISAVVPDEGDVVEL